MLPSVSPSTIALGPLERHALALESIAQRMQRTVTALETAGVRYALVGGQAVAAWVATIDPDAVRTTKDVDVLIERDQLPKARAALQNDFEYFEALGTGMFLDRTDPNPRKAVHLVWAGERVRPEHSVAAPSMEERHRMQPGLWTVSLTALVRMKLVANRDQDRVHLRDMIDVGLVDRSMLEGLPTDLRARLEPLLTEAGR